jgi:formate dehydrogenase gamma subunit
MAEDRRYLRFPTADRIEHWVLTLSFTTLAITGLVQKYASADISRWLMDVLGGIENTRVIHRAAAIVLMLEVVYHLGILGYKIFVRRTRLTMLPGMDDVRAAIGRLQYNVGLRGDYPKEGRYTFAEKAEYWAVVWGTVIMVITGFMLWNPIATANILPGQFIPAAKIAHGGEAVLASLAIIVWHLYSVHVRIFNRSIFTGYLTEEEMAEEHPLELVEIKAGVADRPVSQQQLRERRRPFFAVFAVLAVLLLAGIFWFVTFEETAITTVPPAEDVVVFAPLTPTPFPTSPPTATPRPTATPAPTAETGAPTAEPGEATSVPEAEVIWFDVENLFVDKCGACHSEVNALGGLDLSSYGGAIAGGDSGPVIEPGNPEGSALVALQAEGGHPGQFDETELDLIREWIEAGAPEASPAEAEAPTPTPTAGLVWADVAGLFQAQCGACHSEANALGGLNLSSYEGAIAGGDSGVVVEPGDPAGSTLVALQAEGGHPGQFSDDELGVIRQWIEDGALEVQGSDAGAAEPEAPASEAAEITWQGELVDSFQAKCGACHGEANALGGLDLSSYDSILAGGDSGAVIEPGDPEGSALVNLQAEGGHPGQFDDAELDLIREWIEAGAPEE